MLKHRFNIAHRVASMLRARIRIFLLPCLVRRRMAGAPEISVGQGKTRMPFSPPIAMTDPMDAADPQDQRRHLGRMLHAWCHKMLIPATGRTRPRELQYMLILFFGFSDSGLAANWAHEPGWVMPSWNGPSQK